MAELANCSCCLATVSHHSDYSDYYSDCCLEPVCSQCYQDYLNNTTTAFTCLDCASPLRFIDSRANVTTLNQQVADYQANLETKLRAYNQAQRQIGRDQAHHIDNLAKLAEWYPQVANQLSQTNWYYKDFLITLRDNDYVIKRLTKWQQYLDRVSNCCQTSTVLTRLSSIQHGLSTLPPAQTVNYHPIEVYHNSGLTVLQLTCNHQADAIPDRSPLVSPNTMIAALKQAYNGQPTYTLGERLRSDSSVSNDSSVSEQLQANRGPCNGSYYLPLSNGVLIQNLHYGHYPSITIVQNRLTWSGGRVGRGQVSTEPIGYYHSPKHWSMHSLEYLAVAWTLERGYLAEGQDYYSIVWLRANSDQESAQPRLKLEFPPGRILRLADITSFTVTAEYVYAYCRIQSSDRKNIQLVRFQPLGSRGQVVATAIGPRRVITATSSNPDQDNTMPSAGDAKSLSNITKLYPSGIFVITIYAGSKASRDNYHQAIGQLDLTTGLIIQPARVVAMKYCYAIGSSNSDSRLAAVACLEPEQPEDDRAYLWLQGRIIAVKKSYLELASERQLYTTSEGLLFYENFQDDYRELIFYDGREV